MSRWVHIYLVFHNGVFRDAFASYSEAVRESHGGGCCRIESRYREEY